MSGSTSLDQRLREATRAGDLQAMAKLIDEGASIDHEDAQRIRPLIHAMYCGERNIQALELLLERGAEIDVTSFGEGGPLLLAAYGGDLPIMRLLLAHGANANLAMPGGGESALHAACVKNRCPAAELLLQHGADANLKTKPNGHTDMFSGGVALRGESSLHFAAAYGSPEMIRALLQAGGDKRQVDAHGELPLAYAGRHQRPRELLNLLY